MLRIEVVYSPAPRQVQIVALSLPCGATVQDALGASGLAVDSGALPPVGIWGHPAEPGDALKDGDRVEVYRALRVDPKEARRLRYRAQGQQGRTGRKTP